MSSVPSLRPLLATELRLHRHHGVLLTTAVATAAWCALLLLLPQHVRAAVVGWVLFVDLTALGFTFAPALSVVERGNGVTAATGVTHLTPVRALTVRVGAFTALSVMAASAVLAASRVDGVPAVLAGTVLSSLLFTLLAIALVGRSVSMTAYLSRVPGAAVPLLAPALAHASGLIDSPLLHLSPATGALAMLHGRWSWTAAGWMVLWIVALGVVVVRIGFDVEPRGQAGTRGRRPAAAGPAGASGPVRSFAAVDARVLLSDRIMLLMLAGVPIIALALRWFTTDGVTWVADRHGLDVAAFVPLVVTFVVVIHVPAMVGALVGLLFLEDRDAGLLPALLVTRSSLAVLVAYRLAASVLAAGGCVALSWALIGGAPPSGPAGTLATLLVASSTAALPAAVLAAFGRDRAHGMALMKVMGVPIYAPLAWWFVDGPLGWAFAVSPTGWAARASWAGGPAEAALLASGGTVLTAALLVAILRRLRPL